MNVFCFECFLFLECVFFPFASQKAGKNVLFNISYACWPTAYQLGENVLSILGIHLWTFIINDYVLYFEHLCLLLIQGRATKFLRGLEHLSCKDRTEKVGVVQPVRGSRETLLWPSSSKRELTEKRGRGVLLR